MKQSKIKIYAKALAQVLAREMTEGRPGGYPGYPEKKVVDNFLKLLEKNGLRAKAKEILNLAEDLLLAKEGKRKITFETARRLTADHRALLNEFVKEGDIVKEKVNHELIAGVKITINNEKQFDNSMLNKINNLLCLKK